MQAFQRSRVAIHSIRGNSFALQTHQVQKAISTVRVYAAHTHRPSPSTNSFIYLIHRLSLYVLHDRIAAMDTTMITIHMVPLHSLAQVQAGVVWNAKHCRETRYGYHPISAISFLLTIRCSTVDYQVRPSTRSLDCRTHGQIPPYAGTRFECPDAHYRSYQVRQELEGNCYWSP